MENLDEYLVVARSQSAGKGRRGKGWESPEGGIWLSYIHPLEGISPEGWSLVVALSLLRCWGEDGVKLKWPNDLVMGERKLAGILVEGSWSSGSCRWRTGVGLNLRGGSLELEGDALEPIGLDEVRQEELDYHLVLGELVRSLVAIRREFVEKGFASFVEELNGYSLLNGRTIRYRKEGKSLSGEVVGIGERGHLELKGGESLCSVGQIRW